MFYYLNDLVTTWKNLIDRLFLMVSQRKTPIGQWKKYQLRVELVKAQGKKDRPRQREPNKILWRWNVTFERHFSWIIFIYQVKLDSFDPVKTVIVVFPVPLNYPPVTALKSYSPSVKWPTLISLEFLTLSFERFAVSHSHCGFSKISLPLSYK